MNLEHSLQRWGNLNFYIFLGTAYEFYSISVYIICDTCIYANWALMATDFGIRQSTRAFSSAVLALQTKESIKLADLSIELSERPCL